MEDEEIKSGGKPTFPTESYFDSWVRFDLKGFPSGITTSH